MLLGDGIEREQLERRTSTLPNVHHASIRSSSHVVPQFLTAADVLVVSLHGLPIASRHHAEQGAGLLEGRQAGVGSRCGRRRGTDRGQRRRPRGPPGDRTATVAAVTRLARMPDEELARMGTAARRCFERTFSEDVGSRRLETMLVNAQEDGRP